MAVWVLPAYKNGAETSSKSIDSERRRDELQSGDAGKVRFGGGARGLCPVSRTITVEVYTQFSCHVSPNRTRLFNSEYFVAVRKP